MTAFSDAYDKRTKELTRQILADGQKEDWNKVQDGLKELAHVLKHRGLNVTEALEIRKDIIQTLETINPLAKTHIDVIDKRNWRTQNEPGSKKLYIH